MNEHLLHDYQHYVTSFWIIIVLVLLVVVLVFFKFRRRRYVPQQRFLNTSRRSNSSNLSRFIRDQGAIDVDDADLEAHDTVFIVPDISNYTKFVTSGHFSAARSQEIIFTLINAMIEASMGTFELSKIEGDSVLLYTDASMHSPDKIGQNIIAIFDAFFEEKQLILDSWSAYHEKFKQVDDLDLKIFVHRGSTARFNFRGSVDHFGADVIILHRLMKNSVDGNRYIMVTDAARDRVSLDGNFTVQTIEEDLNYAGTIKATVHKFETPMQLTDDSEEILS